MNQFKSFKIINDNKDKVIQLLDKIKNEKFENKLIENDIKKEQNHNQNLIKVWDSRNKFLIFIKKRIEEENMLKNKNKIKYNHKRTKSDFEYYKLNNINNNNKNNKKEIEEKK